jgi:hypothetical protein
MICGMNAYDTVQMSVPERTWRDLSFLIFNVDGEQEG